MARAGHFLIPGHVITNCEPNPACSVAIHPDHSASEVASAAVSNAAVSKSFEMTTLPHLNQAKCAVFHSKKMAPSGAKVSRDRGAECRRIPNRYPTPDHTT